MRIMRHDRMLMGLGAFLGLCASGCQTGQFQPTGLFSAMAEYRASRRAPAELLSPRVIDERVASVPTGPAATLDSPIVRTSAVQDEMTSGAVVASSWHTLARAPQSEPGVMDLPPHQTGSSISSRYEPLQAEQLHSPRRAAGPVPTEVVISHAPNHGPMQVMGHHPPGIIHLEDQPREGHKMPLPPYVIEPPDLLLIQLLRDPKLVPQPVDGQFLVRPDGRVTIGVYGTVLVAGKTIDQARTEIADLIGGVKNEKGERVGGRVKEQIGEKDQKIDIADQIVVDVLEYASKYCYIIADGAGFGETVLRIPINGSDTILDVVGKIGGLPAQSSKKKIWLARANLGHPGEEYVLPVDWDGIAKRARSGTNYQVTPGDRIYVQSDQLLKFNNKLGKVLNPIERLMGTTLLGATTVHAVENKAAH